MIEQLKRTLICIGVLALTVSACQSNQPLIPVSAPTVDNSAAETLTALVETLSAVSPSLLPATPTPPADLTSTLPSTVQDTPFPTSVPTNTVIPSPVNPLVSVSTATNCRTGPGELYEVVQVVDVGLKFELVGKYSPQNTWIIKLPDGRECWLWGQFAMVEGNVDTLPEMIPPPPPMEGSILVEVRGPKRNGSNDALIDDASVQIQSIPLSAENQHDGTYIFPLVPAGETEIYVTTSSHVPELRSVIVRAGQRRIVPVRLQWARRRDQDCAALPTIQQRINCYLDLEGPQAPTTLPPLLPSRATPTPFFCSPLRPCQPAPTQGPVN